MGIESFDIYFVPLPEPLGDPQAPEPPANPAVPFLAVHRNQHHLPLGPARTGAFVNPFQGEQFVAVLNLLRWLAFSSSSGPLGAERAAELDGLLRASGLPAHEQAQTRPLSEIGIRLFEALFRANPEVDSLWDNFDRPRPADDGGRRERQLRFAFHPSRRTNQTMLRLMALPWEALHPGDEQRGPLGTGPSELVVVRSYRSSIEDPAAPMPPGHPPDPWTPSRILHLTPRTGVSSLLQAYAQQARPEPLGAANHEAWCVVDEPEPLTMPQIEAGLRRRPHILHYFGHGELDEHDAFRFLLDRQQLVGGGLYARRLWLLIEAPELYLFVSWACHSGAVVDPTPAGHRAQPFWVRHSVVTTLADHLPALLVMLTLIDARQAALASRLLYDWLAEGDTLTRALWKVRRELYQRGTVESPGPAEGLWWVPTLYLRDPGATPAFALSQRSQWQLLVGPNYERLDVQRPRLVETVHAAAVAQALVCLTGPVRSGKTRLLQIIAQQAGWPRERLIAFGAPPAGRLWQFLYVNAIKRAVVRVLRGKEGLEPTALHASYVEAVVRAAEPIYLLIDDVHLLGEQAWREIVPPEGWGQLRLIVTADEAQLDEMLIHAVRISLVPHQMRGQELLNLYDEAHALVTRLRALVGGGGPPLIANLLLGLESTVSFEAVNEILHLESDAVDAQREALLLGRLYEHGQLWTNPGFEPMTAPRGVRRRFSAAYHDLRTLWREQNKGLLARMRSVVQHWQQGRSIDEYSDDLLRLLAEPNLSHEASALPPGAERAGGLLLAWFALARRCFRSGLVAVFDQLSNQARARAEVGELERACLALLHDRLAESAGLQVSYRSCVWAAFPRFGAIKNTPDVLTWFAHYPHDEPLADLIRTAMSAAAYRALPQHLVAFVHTLSPPEQQVALRWALVPSMLSNPALVDELLDMVDRQDIRLRIAIACLIAGRYHSQPDHPLVERVREWLFELTETVPFEEIRPLVLVLRPALDPEWRRGFARQILGTLNVSALSGLPPIEPLVAALIAERELDEEQATDWWHHGVPLYTDLAQFARDLLAGLNRDETIFLVTRCEALLASLASHGTTAKEANTLFLTSLAIAGRAAWLLNLWRPFLDLVAQLPTIPYSDLKNIKDNHVIAWLVPPLLHQFGPVRKEALERAIASILLTCEGPGELPELLATMVVEHPDQPELADYCFRGQQAVIAGTLSGGFLDEEEWSDDGWVLSEEKLMLPRVLRALAASPQLDVGQQGLLREQLRAHVRDWAASRGLELDEGEVAALARQLEQELGRLAFTL